jgi:Zn-dependent protease
LFGRPIEIIEILGVKIRIDPSWFVVAVLVTWNFAALAFPAQFPGLPRATYWLMAAAGAVGYFLSILLHELSHALVARTYGIEMRGITLFFFGGFTEMPGEPPSPEAELVIAAAGPGASFGLALGLAGLGLVGSAAGLADPAVGVLFYLSGLNGILTLLNLVPAFPLDGGRILRALLWGWRKNLSWATRVAAGVGSGFGLLLIGLGVVAILNGGFYPGFMTFLIGLFVRNAANGSYQQLLLRRALPLPLQDVPGGGRLRAPARLRHLPAGPQPPPRRMGPPVGRRAGRALHPREHRAGRHRRHGGARPDEPHRRRRPDGRRGGPPARHPLAQGPAPLLLGEDGARRHRQGLRAGRAKLV